MQFTRAFGIYAFGQAYINGGYGFPNTGIVKGNRRQFKRVDAQRGSAHTRGKNGPLHISTCLPLRQTVCVCMCVCVSTSTY